MDIASIYCTQDYEQYHEDNHAVWRTLCRRQIDSLRGTACSAFYEGMERTRIDLEHVPRLDDINERITPITGWSARAVPGYIDSRYFFQSLQKRIFPTTTTLRPADSLDYLEEPDIFHDVFGHVAMMAHPVYGELLRTLGGINDVITTDQDVLELTRLFWFTVEFGLVLEDGEAKIYGSGLLSSHGESKHCLSNAVCRKPFELAEVIRQPFRIDVYQDVLFVAESFEQLIEATRVLIYQIKERNSIRWTKKK